MVGQAEEKERRLNKSRKRLEKKLVRARRVLASLHTLRVFHSRGSLTIVNAHGTSLLPMCCVCVRSWKRRTHYEYQYTELFVAICFFCPPTTFYDRNTMGV